MSCASWSAPCADCRELTLRISQGLACAPFVDLSPPVFFPPHPPHPPRLVHLVHPVHPARPVHLAPPLAFQCPHLLFQMCPHVPARGRDLRQVHAPAAKGPVVVGAVGAHISRLPGGPECQICDMPRMYVVNAQ